MTVLYYLIVSPKICTRMCPPDVTDKQTVSRLVFNGDGCGYAIITVVKLKGSDVPGGELQHVKVDDNTDSTLR